ncbi:MAG TPA: hypothetical protein VMI94_12260 [Bryobacteraceae bacterium]|nr:hypothetical protein [Bryobacteraceae bacterium]
MALAWRLQTLATANGIEMYVPNHGGAAPPPGAVSIQKAIGRADYVLAIITAGEGPSVQNELRYALEKRKLVIPIVRVDLAGSPLLAQFPRVFTFSPWDSPEPVETQIVEFLKEQQVTREKQQAIGALAALGLGLLLLVSLNKE